MPGLLGSWHKASLTDVSVGQISVTTAAADLLGTELLVAGLVLHAVGSLTQGITRVARRCGGWWGRAPWAPVGSAALPALSGTAPGASGDVRQPRKPFVTLNRFDNVPISFNVTYPRVCASVIERDIGQI